MTQLILVFGALILLAGIAMVINPETIFGFLRNNVDKPALHVGAIALRVVLGVLLILQSDVSRYPLVIEVIGWIAIVAAISLAVIGRRNFNRLMTWALSFSKPLGRVAGVFAAAFGAFLIYSFVA